jgi:UDPglucose 6-dehydrogenase
LVSGARFADFGHQVICVDKDVSKIAALEAGKMPIYEPGLEALVKLNRAEGRPTFATEVGPAVESAEVVFIAVGTPTRGDEGEADLRFVYGAAQDIAAAITNFTVIVNKSTVPVGTGDAVERIIRTARPDADFAVVSNPEFLREGTSIYEPDSKFKWRRFSPSRAFA